ncbi:hypothetical protein [Catenuloplanes japonicus]|uniref:hypothetical protein n=1 Tax=Catenuloplanes japonicus TaxID=33876 RepID=UPI000A0F9471|nr:hypothetical protein [Catenuloplanes japonicus]
MGIDALDGGPQCGTRFPALVTGAPWQGALLEERAPQVGPQPATAHAFRLATASPAIDAGVPIVDNGGRDHTGAPLHDGMGAFEYGSIHIDDVRVVQGVNYSSVNRIQQQSWSRGPVSSGFAYRPSTPLCHPTVTA